MEIIVIYVILRMVGKIKQDYTDEMLYVKSTEANLKLFDFRIFLFS